MGRKAILEFLGEDVDERAGHYSVSSSGGSNSSEFMEEDEDDERDTEFNEKVEQVLSCNNIINECDEFNYFTQVMKYIKENDKDIYNYLVESRDGRIFENLYKVRNIKVKYKDREFTVPRKTVKIIRKNQ